MNEIMEKVEDLVKAIKNSDEEIEDKQDSIKDVERYILSFPEYYNSVINHVVQGSLCRVLYEGEEYRDKMMALDSRRRRCHIMATEAVNKINRLALYYGTKEIFQVDHTLNSEKIEDRELAVNMAFQFCGETFLDEVKRSGYNISKETQNHVLQHMIDKGDRFQTTIKNKNEWEL